MRDDCDETSDGGVGGECECRGEPDGLDRDELCPSLDVKLETDDVENRDRVGNLGRVKVVVVVVEVAVEEWSLRRETFLPQESSPNIAAGVNSDFGLSPD